MIGDENALDEENFWIDGTGARHEIATMDLRHCRNVYDYLMRNAQRIVSGMYDMVALSTPPTGEVALDAFDAMVDEMSEAMDAPRTYLAKQPLLQALERRMDGSSQRAQNGKRAVAITVHLQVPQPPG